MDEAMDESKGESRAQVGASQSNGRSIPLIPPLNGYGRCIIFYFYTLNAVPGQRFSTSLGCCHRPRGQQPVKLLTAETIQMKNCESIACRSRSMGSVNVVISREGLYRRVPHFWDPSRRLPRLPAWNPPIDIADTFGNAQSDQA